MSSPVTVWIVLGSAAFVVIGGFAAIAILVAAAVLNSQNKDGDL